MQHGQLRVISEITAPLPSAENEAGSHKTRRHQNSRCKALNVTLLTTTNQRLSPSQTTEGRHRSFRLFLVFVCLRSQLMLVDSSQPKSQPDRSTQPGMFFVKLSCHSMTKLLTCFSPNFVLTLKRCAQLRNWQQEDFESW